MRAPLLASLSTSVVVLPSARSKTYPGVQPMAASILLRVRDWGHLVPSRKLARVPGSTPARLANASRPSGATSRLTARLTNSRLMTVPSCNLEEVWTRRKITVAQPRGCLPSHLGLFTQPPSVPDDVGLTAHLVAGSLLVPSSSDTFRHEGQHTSANSPSMTPSSR